MLENGKENGKSNGNLGYTVGQWGTRNFNELPLSTAHRRYIMSYKGDISDMLGICREMDKKMGATTSWTV